MENLGKRHFEDIFRAPLEISIVEFIQIAQYFLRMVNKEESWDLMEEVSVADL